MSQEAIGILIKRNNDTLFVLKTKEEYRGRVYHPVDRCSQEFIQEIKTALVAHGFGALLDGPDTVVNPIEVLGSTFSNSPIHLIGPAGGNFILADRTPHQYPRKFSATLTHCVPAGTPHFHQGGVVGLKGDEVPVILHAGAEQPDHFSGGKIADNQKHDPLLQNEEMIITKAPLVPNKAIFLGEEPIKPYSGLTDEAMELVTNMRHPTHAKLAKVLFDAFNRSANGKGQERHGRGLKFEDQPICSIPRMLANNGGLDYQIVKKLDESNRMDYERARKETLDIIVYAAAKIVMLDEANAKQPPNS